MAIQGELGARPLVGRVIALEPLAAAHRAALQAAADDPQIWTYMPENGAGGAFGRYFDAALGQTARGEQITYAVRRLADDALVGSTSYLANVPRHRRVEIGWTWYIPAVHGSAVNPEAKLLLLANAFETCGYRRVELKCDSRNLRSRAAILKLGATQEGTLRSHMWVHGGYWRDTVYFSILREEWPGVKTRLEARLAGAPV